MILFNWIELVGRDTTASWSIKSFIGILFGFLKVSDKKTSIQIIDPIEDGNPEECFILLTGFLNRTFTMATERNKSSSTIHTSFTFPSTAMTMDTFSPEQEILWRYLHLV